MLNFSNFKYAFNGIYLCWRSEFNFRIHALSMLSVISLGIYFSLSETEWILIIISCVFVLVAEMFNTAIENICDIITHDFNPIIKTVKDISAGAVLVTAIGSIMVGCVIFIPKIFF